MDMTNKLINEAFLDSVDTKTRVGILAAVAEHYGITKEQALEEVTHEEAEHLLDYLTGSLRAATSVLMSRHRLGCRVSA